jgi:hypothetical protein
VTRWRSGGTGRNPDGPPPAPAEARSRSAWKKNAARSRTHRHPEVLCRHVLQLVRLVDDRHVALGNHLAVGVLPDGGVRAQQMVIDDHDVRFGGTLAHPRDEAVRLSGARRADAALGRRGQVEPHRQILRQVLEFRAVAGPGACRPIADGRHGVGVGKRHRHRILAEEIEAVKAEVVAPPLHVCGLERDAERVLQDGEVLREDLFLERLGAGRDEHAPAAQDRRDEVRDGLAGAGAGFGKQDVTFFDGRGHRGGHRPLARSRLELGHCPGQRSIVVEHPVDGRRQASGCRVDPTAGHPRRDLRVP